MASISTNKRTGIRRVIFLNPDGERKGISLGAISMKSAESVRDHIADILDCRSHGVGFDADTKSWLMKISNRLSKALAKNGVIEPRAGTANSNAATLGPFIDSYLAMRNDVKPSTMKTWKQTRKLLVDFFGATKRIDTITALNAQAWRLGLVGDAFAEASVRKHTGLAKGFFSAAIDGGLIVKNPFAKLKSGSVGNEARMRFIDRATIDKVLDAAPSATWRAIIALSRYGGLRTPSETHAIRWTDVLWDQGKLRVPSPKTERAGKAERIIPLFPEIEGPLRELYDMAPDGAEFVIDRAGSSAPDNVRTQMARIVRRAGVVPWPRIFQNLRSTRETELAETFPVHVVTAWIGNTEAVARKHYLQVTDEHFAKAAKKNDAQSYARNSETEGNARKGKGRRETENAKNVGKFEKSEVCVNLKAGADGNRTHLASLQTPRRV